MFLGEGESDYAPPADVPVDTSFAPGNLGKGGFDSSNTYDYGSGTAVTTPEKSGGGGVDWSGLFNKAVDAYTKITTVDANANLQKTIATSPNARYYAPYGTSGTGYVPGSVGYNYTYPRVNTPNIYPSYQQSSNDMLIYAGAGALILVGLLMSRSK